MSSFVSSFKVDVSNPKSHLGGKKSQQDCGTVFVGTTWTAVGVWDGHGEDGFSNAAMEACQKIISDDFYEQLLLFPQKAADQLFDAQQASNVELLKQNLIKRGIPFDFCNGRIVTRHYLCLRGGTTATIVFVGHNGLVTTLNVGDSDAWLYNSTTSLKLTADHFAETPEEYERIMAIEGATCEYDCPHMMRPRSSSVIRPEEITGTLRPYYISNLDKKAATVVRAATKLKHIDEDGTKHPPRGGALAMSRSIGDEHLKSSGVIHTPSVSHHQITDNSIIKVASDGYWDSEVTSVAHGKMNKMIEKVGYDADALVEDWFQKNKAVSDDTFGMVGDNWWGYVITITS